MEITGLNAEETEKINKQLIEDGIFGAMNFDIPTPTIEAYAKRNNINWDNSVEIK